MSNRHVRLVAWIAGVSWLSYAVATGPPAAFHNSDSLIPIFVSLEHWTPFYWDQDRFGMFIPFLTLPIRDGFWNLIAQNGISLAVFLVGSAALFRRIGLSAPRICAVALLAALLAWRTGDVRQMLLTTDQSYAPALGLFGLAVALAPVGRWWPGWAAVVLMILGAWVNAGVALLVGSLGTVAAATSRLRPIAMPIVIGVVLSLLAHAALQTLAPDLLLGRTRLDMPSGGFVSAVSAFWADLNRRMVGPLGWILPAALAGAWLIGRRQGPEQRTAMIAIPLGIALYAGVMVFGFLGAGRHMAPVIPIVLGLAIAVSGLRWPGLFGSRVALVAVVACAVVQLGFTSPGEARRRLVETLGKGHARELDAAGAAAVTGDYWSVWPLTFALNLLHEEVDGRRPVLPVTMRAEAVFVPRQAELKEGLIVVAVPPGDHRHWSLHSTLPSLVWQAQTPAYSLFRIGPPR